MRITVIPLALLLALCACQTASYKQTKVLAGTNWVADSPPAGRLPLQELEFGSKLAPSGMGNVKIAPGQIILFQVINEKLVMRADFLDGRNHNFDFDIDGDKLTLTTLDDDGKPAGVQRFKREDDVQKH